MTWIKDPDATLDYGFDWSKWLGEDTITASSWTVEAGITKNSDTFDTTTTTIWLSNGTVGQTYSLTNRVTTAAGRIDERTRSVTVRDR